MASLMAPLRCALARQGRSTALAIRAFPSGKLGSRSITAAASSNVAKMLQAELKHEEGQYEQAKEIKSFLKSSPFKLVDNDGDVNMALEREVGDKIVRVEWQLTSPFDPEAEEEGLEGAQDHETTDMSITCEDKKTGASIAFYCSTQPGDDHRYVIGNVKASPNAEERDSISSYNGPEFEDIDEKLQEGFDEYLADMGVSTEVCDFVDAMALDKEQREYIRWLKVTKAFLED